MDSNEILNIAASLGSPEVKQVLAEKQRSKHGTPHVKEGPMQICGSRLELNEMAPEQPMTRLRPADLCEEAGSSGKQPN